MKAKWITGPLGAMLMLAPVAFSQEAATPAAATPTHDAATAEAKRQGTVALKPNANQSPPQTMSQAVAFERYKERAAAREAQKEGTATSADRSVEKPVKAVKPPKQ